MKTAAETPVMLPGERTAFTVVLLIS